MIPCSASGGRIPRESGDFLFESKRDSSCYIKWNVYCIREIFCYDYSITPDEVMAVL